MLQETLLVEVIVVSEIIVDVFDVGGVKIERHAHIHGDIDNVLAMIAKLKRNRDIKLEFEVIRILYNELGYKGKEIANILGMSKADVSRRLSIINNLIEPLKERVVAGELRLSTAWELSKLSPEVQEEYVNAEKITLAEVQERRRMETIGNLDLSSIEIPPPESATTTAAESEPERFELKPEECKISVFELPISGKFLFVVKVGDKRYEAQVDCEEVLRWIAGRLGERE